MIRLGPLPLDDLLGDSAVAAILGFLLRWAVAAALLTLAVGIVVRTAPADDRPLHWVSFGSALTVGGGS